VENPKHRIIKDGKSKLKAVHGAFQCTNRKCVSYKNKRAIQTRDTMSALAIGLLGLSTLLFSKRIPSFTRYNTSQSYTGYKNTTTACLLNL
jgi:hypothetical protein